MRVKVELDGEGQQGRGGKDGNCKRKDQPLLGDQKMKSTQVSGSAAPQMDKRQQKEEQQQPSGMSRRVGEGCDDFFSPGLRLMIPAPGPYCT